jgi:tetratricopeptide (TPR) repeat protein
VRDTSTFASRYNLAQSPDWQALLRLFELNEGFAFIVLLVVNEEGSEVCRDALAKRLRGAGKELLELETTQDRLKEIANALLLTDACPETGAVWVSRVVSEGARDYGEWREAWRRGVAALNQHRNPLRRKWSVPVVFVGAPWLQEVLRENAPDLWSVRTQVAWVEPEAPAADAYVARIYSDVPRRGPDPQMALAEAERLRGKKGSELILARLLYRAGLGFAARSQWPEAARVLEESLEIRRGSGAEPEDIADSCFQLGIVLISLAEYAAGTGRIQDALVLYRQTGNPLGESNCIYRLAGAAHDRSNYEEAQQLYSEALSLCRKGGFTLGAVSCIEKLGDVALDRLDLVEAWQHYRKALPAYRQLGEELGEANCTWGIANISLRRSDYESARRWYTEALGLYRRVGSRLGAANCMAMLGEIAFNSWNQAEAQRWFEEAQALFREVGNLQGEANCVRSLGDILRNLADDQAARRLYEQALDLYARIPEPYSIGLTHRGLASLAVGDERTRHLQAARDAWLSIDRPDLVEQLDDEFTASR